MFDLIKPNKKWEVIARNLDADFIKGNLWKPTMIKLVNNNHSFEISTSFTNDNLWTGKTIIKTLIDFNSEIKLSISKGYIINGASIKVRTRNKKEDKKLLSILNQLDILNELGNSFNKFRIRFETYNHIDSKCRVSSAIIFETKMYIENENEFKLIFKALIEIITELKKIYR